MAGLLDLLFGSDDAPLDRPRRAASARSRNETTGPSILEHMLKGMDNPASAYAETPLVDLWADEPEPSYDWRKRTRDRYLAQRGMRSLSSLIFGLPDIANDVVNAGIRDIDYFTGGGLSGGSYEPYQIPSTSQSVADQVAEVSGADIIPREAVPPSTQRTGDWVETGVGLLPIGGAIMAPVLKSRQALGILAGADDKGWKNLASRSANIYDPPNKPAREFALDYPSGAKVDDTGRLLESIDGYPLGAERIVGRRTLGGEDVAILPSEYDAIAEAAIGSVPQAVEARALPGKTIGAFRPRYSPEGQPQHSIGVLKTLSPNDKDRVTAHEMSHMLDKMARKWANDPAANIPAGMRSELNTIYNDLNNRDLNEALRRGYDVERNPRKVYRGYKPEHAGYRKGQESDEELIAELVRAYMTNPNYAKTVAPKATKWWRERANPDPLIKKNIQFNGLATAATPVGLMSYLLRQEEEQ